MGKNNCTPTNIISKEAFISILDFIKMQREKWDSLQSAMEELSPGEYVNFWPYFAYETHITNLLDTMFNITDSTSPISLFMVEGEFGNNKSYLIFEDANAGETIDISTPEKLYDYALSFINLKENK